MRLEKLIETLTQITEEVARELYLKIGDMNENQADELATQEMRKRLNKLEIDGKVVIGEGEIDEAPMLHIGEKIGKGIGPKLDIAVDPLEGTSPTVKGEDNGLIVIAMSKQGTLLHAPDMYMKKMVTEKKYLNKLNLDDSFINNVKRLAHLKGKRITEMVVAIQNRPRHRQMIEDARANGFKLVLFEDGDIMYSLAACLREYDIDMFYGIGGAPEGVLAAVALNAIGGGIQAKLCLRNSEEEARCQKMGIKETNKIMQTEDLISSDQSFFIATAVTNNILIKGVKQEENSLVTETIVLNNLTKQKNIKRKKYQIKKSII